MEEFCDTLKSAGASIMYPGTPTDPLTQAEGYRYLSRLTRAGLEAFVEYADPRAPVLRRMIHETAKMGSDNPDNYYQNATIDGTLTYRISGTRGTVDYLGFGTQEGNYGQGGRCRRPDTSRLGPADRRRRHLRVDRQCDPPLA